MKRSKDKTMVIISWVTNEVVQKIDVFEDAKERKKMPRLYKKN
jgi:hypothetical protein